jgi:hypothetical protein
LSPEETLASGEESAIEGSKELKPDGFRRLLGEEKRGAQTAFTNIGVRLYPLDVK